MTTKVHVVFYSMYGHIYQLSEAVAEGARSVEGIEVKLLQVPELVPPEALERTGASAARSAFSTIPVAKPADLTEADAIIFGTRRASETCAPKCETSWIKPAAYGPKAH